MTNIYFISILLLSFAMSLSGCAKPKPIFPVTIFHSKIEANQVSKGATIIVKPFIDNRNENQIPYVGEILEPINAYPLPPLPLPTKSGRFIVEKNRNNIAGVLTGSFVDALKSLGYTVLTNTSSTKGETKISPITHNAVLEGEVYEFWLTPYWTTKQLICIELKLYNKEGDHLLWEKEIRAEHSQFVGVWSSDAFEEVIQKALDKALSQAIEAFESEEFQQKVFNN